MVDIISDGMIESGFGGRLIYRHDVQFIADKTSNCQAVFNLITIVTQDYAISPEMLLQGLVEVINDSGLKVRFLRPSAAIMPMFANIVEPARQQFCCAICTSLAEEGTDVWAEDCIHGGLRTHETWLHPVQDGLTFLGRRGVCPLTNINGINIADSLVTDVNATCTTGVGKFIIDNLILSKDMYDSEEERLAMIASINAMWTAVKVPSEVKMPTAISKEWEADDYNWFFLLAGHCTAELLHEGGKEKIAKIIARWTYMFRALLLNDSWLRIVDKDVQLIDLLIKLIRDIYSVVSHEHKLFEFHQLRHVLHARNQSRLHLLSIRGCEVAPNAQKKMNNTHYGMAVREESLFKFTASHFCNDFFKYDKLKEHSTYDDSLLVNRDMRVHR